MESSHARIRPVFHRLLLATALALPGFAALRAETEENIQKKFEVKAGGNLVVDVDFGSIEVSAGSGQHVGIQITRRISRGSKSDEEDFLQERPVVVSQDGDTVTIRSKSENRTSWSWKGLQRNEAKYVVTVPARFNAKLKTSGGGIEVRDLEGEVKAGTSGGGLKFARIKGPLDGRTSGGGIRLNGCEGAVAIHTSGGGIEVDGGHGSLDGHTSGGSIQVKAFRGDLKVRTSGGGIRIEEAAGRVEASTSGGSISASLAKISDAVRLETSGGSVTLRTSPDAAFDLDASSSGGGASSELPVAVTGKPSRNHLKGPVNGGGRTVQLRSSGGGVHVKKL